MGGLLHSTLLSITSVNVVAHYCFTHIWICIFTYQTFITHTPPLHKCRWDRCDVARAHSCTDPRRCRWEMKVYMGALLSALLMEAYYKEGSEILKKVSLITRDTSKPLVWPIEALSVSETLRGVLEITVSNWVWPLCRFGIISTVNTLFECILVA